MTETNMVNSETVYFFKNCTNPFEFLNDAREDIYNQEHFERG